MAYVGERLYDEFIRKNMANLASRVKVREIVPYLACLTNTDRVNYAIHCTKHAFKLCVLKCCLLDKIFSNKIILMVLTITLTGVAGGDRG